MATVETRKLTADEFFAFSQRPENAEKRHELFRGEVIELPPPTKPHGFICANAVRILGNYAADTGAYVVSNDTGLVVERGNDDTVRGPDVCYFDDGQTPETMDPKYSETTPRLIVEVRSPSDRERDVRRRVSEYLRLGVPIVWLVEMEDRYVTVYRAGQIHRNLDEADTLDGEDVLPGLTCRVADLFRTPRRFAEPQAAIPGPSE